MKDREHLAMNLQFFAEETPATPEPAAPAVEPEVIPPTQTEMQKLSGMLAAVDAKTEDPPQSTEEAVPATETPATETKPEPPKPAKADYAFAQMRTENAQLKGLLTKLAKATGIDAADEKELLTKLNDDALSKLATQQGVPKELLERMEKLEGIEALYAQEQIKANAATGFNKLATEFALDEPALIAFAAELDDDGLNPFEQKVDLFNEYRLRHYDDIMEKKVAAAVEAALKKDVQATTNSSVPSTKQGTPPATPGKITSVASLKAMLAGVDKK